MASLYYRYPVFSLPGVSSTSVDPAPPNMGPPIFFPGTAFRAFTNTWHESELGEREHNPNYQMLP